MFDICALGEILIDFTPIQHPDGQAFVRNAGGAPANVLATAAKFGSRCAFLGKVGDDMFGRFLEASLLENRITTDGLVFDKTHNTTLAFVALDETGDRDFSFYRNFGADIFLTEDEVNTDLIASSSVFHFGSLSLTDEPARSATLFALQYAKEHGCRISFDPNYREMLWDSPKSFCSAVTGCLPFVDILKVSLEEAQLITGLSAPIDAAMELLQQDVGFVLITDGGNGVTYAAKDGSGHLPSLSVTPVDTTGAGDIFFGTFLHAGLQKNGLKDLSASALKSCIEKAIRISGISTLKHGAIASIPDYDA